MTLGVIGGLGPEATAYFMELVTAMTDAGCDQEHLNMIVYSCPKIPDRTAFIMGRSQDSPVKPMIAIGNKLAGLGVDAISIPCITAHHFYRELADQISVPIIHAVYETGVELQRQGIRRAGVLATEGTVRSQLFQRQLEEQDIEAVVPDALHQTYVNELIYRQVKAGRPVELEKFEASSAYLRAQGAEIIILGCTELSLIKRDFAIGTGYLDAMEVLAQRSVLYAGGKLKEEFQHLISTGGEREYAEKHFGISGAHGSEGSR